MTHLKIEYVPFASLTPSKFNSRAHSDEQIEQIATSIRQFGFTAPILVDDTLNIIAGEGRYYAAKKVQRREVPVIKLAHLTEAQKRAYIIADNQLALNSTWDEKKLQDEILALINMDFNIGTLGMSNEELDEIIKGVHTGPETIPVEGYVRKKQGTPRAAADQENTKRLAVIVYCENEEDREQVYGQLTDMAFDCKKATL